MDISIVGLGKMGLNMGLRLLRDDHRVVGYNRSSEPLETLEEEGGRPAASLSSLVDASSAPRVVWLMLPAGEITDEHLQRLYDLLEEGDLLVDGANSYYRDTLRRSHEAKAHGLRYVDVGVSGGIWGLENGYSLMVGGDPADVERVEPALRSLAPAPDQGWGHVGPTGAGHFVKMVHNGIEYGMMQAIAEGFSVLHAKDAFTYPEVTDADGERLQRTAEEGVEIDLGAVAEIWRSGSVIQSWLIDLAAEVLQERPDLEGIAPYVPDSGEGRWTVEEGIRLRVPTTVIAASLFQRFDSRDEHGFAKRMLSALRGQFGGHPVKGTAEDGGAADERHEDGTIDVVPGGVQTEGATTRS